jgi:hypothetical protein
MKITKTRMAPRVGISNANSSANLSPLSTAMDMVESDVASYTDAEDTEDTEDMEGKADAFRNATEIIGLLITDFLYRTFLLSIF